MIKNILLGLTRRGDLALAILLGLVVFLMVLPMPTLLVDAFIAVNIAMAIVLLMIAVYIPTPLSFSTLPSVLLLSTLFRLALTITTTRLILSQADAGEIVYAFGDFVVAGNLVVGVVVFLIITIVQFIVITKGAERVAEVCARFSLDGMPGKQMSIDADLRAGVIDTAEAVRRRSRLEQRSQLYGSMDGAMKFVKGDAIAGLCIIAVNIVGGIAIGIFQHDMSVADALAIYTTLTIGDGLVGQIPALFIAITAGIIVTRTTSDESTDNLGSDISAQILAQPNALLVAGAACFGLALLPGFPAIVFLIGGVIIGGIGLAVKSVDRQRRDAAGLMSEVPDAQLRPGNSGARGTARLSLTLSAGHVDPLALRELNAEIAKLRAALLAQRGLQFPTVHLHVDELPAPGDDFAVEVRGVPVQIGTLPEGQRYFSSTTERLGLACSGGGWVAEEDAASLQDVGMTGMSHAQYLANALGEAFDKHASDLLGLQEAKALLDGAQVDCPELVKELAKCVSLQQLTHVLKLLVAEGVSIRDLPAIIESLADAGRTHSEPAILAEQVRVQLRRQICHSLSSAAECGGVLPVLVLSKETEDTIRQQLESQDKTGASADVALRLHKAVAPWRGGAGSERAIALVTSADLRCRVRHLLRIEGATTPVLSYSELPPDWPVQPLGHLRLA